MRCGAVRCVIVVPRHFLGGKKYNVRKLASRRIQRAPISGRDGSLYRPLPPGRALPSELLLPASVTLREVT